MFLHSQMTLPASPTPTSPTKMLLRITTLASLVLYSFASLVSRKICVFTYQVLVHLMFCLGHYFDLSPPLCLCRQSGWVRKASWHPPGVCVPLWGFWWEREQVQTKQPCLRQPCQIHHQRIHRGIATWWVCPTVILSLIELVSESFSCSGDIFKLDMQMILRYLKTLFHFLQLSINQITERNIIFD